MNTREVWTMAVLSEQCLNRTGSRIKEENWTLVSNYEFPWTRLWFVFTTLCKWTHRSETLLFSHSSTMTLTYSTTLHAGGTACYRGSLLLPLSISASTHTALSYVLAGAPTQYPMVSRKERCACRVLTQSLHYISQHSLAYMEREVIAYW